MNIEIAKRLAERRREAGYSQEALAEKLGVTRQAVSKWERSESSPDTDNLIALARLYSVSLDELLNVDPTIAEDVEFEAADRAASARLSGETMTSTNSSGDGGSYVHINPIDGVHVKDGNTGEEVHVGWRGIHIQEGSGRGWSGEWRDWRNWREWQNNDYDIDVSTLRDAATMAKLKTWNHFPFPLLMFIVYLLVGIFAPPITENAGTFDGWQYGLFLIAALPMYYIAGDAIIRRRPARFVQGFYPLAVMTTFLWFWLIEGMPHPTWVLFLTIPIVEWVCHTISYSKQREVSLKITIEPDDASEEGEAL